MSSTSNILILGGDVGAVSPSSDNYLTNEVNAVAFRMTAATVFHAGFDTPTEEAYFSDTLWDSPLHVTLAVILVFILSPITICCNAMLVASISRFKRLRNPSNYFVLALASADLGVGMLMPFGLYFEFSRPQIDCVILCLFPYCVMILVCSVSILSVTAVALDRYTSLASPLKYNNIITHRSVGRYIAVFWIYSLLLGSSPIIYWYYDRSEATVNSCSFDLVLNQVRIFLVFALFAPCTLLMVGCYSYVYVVARYHARAIFSVERFRFQNGTNTEAKYGRTLTLIVGLFLVFWLPFVVCMMADIFQDANLLSGKTTFYLGLLGLSSSAVNPLLYGFRSSEFRYAFLKILEDLMPKLSKMLLKRRSITYNSCTGAVTSCASNIRLCNSPNMLLKPPVTGNVRYSTYLMPPDNIVELSGPTTPLLNSEVIIMASNAGEIGVQI